MNPPSPPNVIRVASSAGNVLIVESSGACRNNSANEQAVVMPALV